MPNTLADWLSYLESLHPKTIALGLERVAEVKQRLTLHPDFPVIIVGGTNGKGSVCAMLESILHAAGYKVGCYTSPHLLHYNERVRIGKQQASDAELCASFEAIERARTTRFPSPLQGEGLLADEISLTYFEFGTLAAMQCFIEHQVDVAILEVGLGGRLDAVNVFDADVAVVTSVDIDHVDYLGDTREKIAFEKAGIFRSGWVAICADSDVPTALRDHAAAIGAKLWCIGSEFGFRLPSPAGGRGAGEEGISGIPLSRPDGHPQDETTSHSTKLQTSAAKSLVIPQAGEGKIQWDYYSQLGARNALPIPALRGAYQLGNASAVLAALDALREPLPVGNDAVRRGLVEVQLAGRFQFVPGVPQLILDVAHNPHAARSLAQNLADLPPAQTCAVFAMLKDKDMAGVVEALKDRIDVWLVAGIDAPRGAAAEELVQVVRAAGVSGRVEPFSSVAEALTMAQGSAATLDRIVVFGSFYTVAGALQALSIRI